MVQTGQGRGLKFRDKIMTIHCHKLTNECGSNQGAVTKFIRSPRTAISFHEKRLRGVVCCVKKKEKKKENQQKDAKLFLFDK